MKLIKIYSLLFLSLFLSNNLYALSMSSHVVEHFKKTICQCCEDALAIKGEFKNNGYYVNLKDGNVKGHSFNNVLIKFENLTNESRNNLLNEGINISKLQKCCNIKIAGEISLDELQQIIDKEVVRVSSARRIFDSANFSFQNSCVVVSGNINMKRVPGNPFAMFTGDSFSPYSAKLGVRIVGPVIYLNIIEGNINGEEMSPELKKVFLDWLNPLWDFSKLGFDCEIKSYNITPNGLTITATVF